ncbi:hypothetical protein RZN22_03210 [Bacillaceae bacterium S4-13-58]
MDHPYVSEWENYKNKITESREALSSQFQSLDHQLQQVQTDGDQQQYADLLDQWQRSKGQLDNADSLLEQLDVNQWLRG